MSDPNAPQYPQQPTPYGQPGQPSGEQYPPSYPQYPPQTGPYTGQPPNTAPQYPGYPQYPQGQPGYPPGQPYYAPGSVPPPQQKKSNRGLWITLGIVGGVLLVACVACSIFLVGALRGATSNPIVSSTITTGLFCGYEQGQTYDQAYSEFSSTLKQQVTLDQFTQAAQQHDATDGVVKTCKVDSSSSAASPQISNTEVVLPLVVTRGQGSTTTGNITLEKDGSSFKISAIDSSLNLL